jgi:triosephosphate isomerase (TIM)
MRKKIVAGNWKMNKNLVEARELTSEIVNMVNDEIRGSVEVVIIPPFVHLTNVLGLAKGSAVKVGAQNCHQEKGGAFTGEVSASMLSSLGGLHYVIIGHSERRQYFSEDNALLASKVNAVLAEKLIPIYCCGETLEERNSGKHFEIIAAQVKEGLFHLDEEKMKDVVIAYEPVWAIGTGVTASSAQAQEVHAFIRKLLAEKYGNDLAQRISILYGGSVKADNASELFACADIDGGLIGGASLQSRSFTDIARAFN